MRAVALWWRKNDRIYAFRLTLVVTPIAWLQISIYSGPLRWQGFSTNSTIGILLISCSGTEQDTDIYCFTYQSSQDTRPGTLMNSVVDWNIVHKQLILGGYLELNGVEPIPRSVNRFIFGCSTYWTIKPYIIRAVILVTFFNEQREKKIYQICFINYNEIIIISHFQTKPINKRAMSPDILHIRKFKIWSIKM